MIKRDLYMKILLEFKNKSVIKIVTGIRRCGKSTLLKLFAKNLLVSGVKKENIIQINFESIKYADLKNYIELYRYVESKLAKNGKTYLIFDEIQMVTDWQKAIDSFLVDHDVDIYITGSNAYLLSSEFSTLLSGRYVEIKMLPLSFKEFLDFNSLNHNETLDDKFRLYLKFGGMPGTHELGFNENRINDMLEGVYSTVVLKDVLERNQVSDQPLLQKIVKFLADSVGSTISPNSIGNVLANEKEIENNKQKNKPASKTVAAYIEMLEKSFIFYSANRYDIRGKQLLKTLGKYYIVDIGIRNMLLGYRDVNRGHILENIVYFELLRRGYRIWIGKIGDKEVDFVAENPSNKMYIQVTESLDSEKTRERELTPLKAINDNYEKIIITTDKDFIESYEGIKLKNIIDWLLEE